MNQVPICNQFLVRVILKHRKPAECHFTRPLHQMTYNQETKRSSNKHLIPITRSIDFLKCQPELCVAGKGVGTSKGGQLAVLMCWLQAEERHIEKYRQFYLRRGFDVLAVKTSPRDLFLPDVGVRKISRDYVRFLVENKYPNVLVHCFSVGGYMFGRAWLDMDKLEPETRYTLQNSIRGAIYDSLVTYEGVPPGLARSLASSPLGVKVLEKLLRLYLKSAYNFATKHYVETSDRVWTDPMRCPTLFLMSRDDKIADYKIIERLRKVWTGFGVDCRLKLVESCPHVQMYTRHHDWYVKQVDDFIRYTRALPQPPAQRVRFDSL